MLTIFVILVLAWCVLAPAVSLLIGFAIAIAEEAEKARADRRKP